MMKNEIAETSTYQNTLQIIKRICLDKCLYNQPMQALRTKSHSFQRGDKNYVKYPKVGCLSTSVYDGESPNFSGMLTLIKN